MGEYPSPRSACNLAAAGGRTCTLSIKGFSKLLVASSFSPPEETGPESVLSQRKEQVRLDGFLGNHVYKRPITAPAISPHDLMLSQLNQFVDYLPCSMTSLSIEPRELSDVLR
jgi:hypothetical protein